MFYVTIALALSLCIGVITGISAYFAARTFSFINVIHKIAERLDMSLYLMRTIWY